MSSNDAYQFVRLHQQSLLGIFVGLLLASLAYWFWLQFTLPVWSSELADAPFVISPNETPQEARTRLVSEGYVRSARALGIVERFSGAGIGVPGEYDLKGAESLREVVAKLSEPQKQWVTIDDSMSREEVARTFGEALEWDPFTERRFVTAQTSITWDHFNEALVPYLSHKYEWTQTEAQTFSSLAAFYVDPEYDILGGLLVNDSYLVAKDMTLGALANMLVDSVNVAHASSTELFDERVMSKTEELANVQKLITGQVELLPDLVPLPPSDVVLERRGGEDALVFTTTYWNEGKGALELRADPGTQGIYGDQVRDIFQRIYKVDGTHRDRLAGTFEWHQEHLHYHFEDFVDYQLNLLESDSGENTLGTTTVAQQKTTFCIRDVDSVNTSVDSAFNTPTYRICGKERQGISLGWGDTYYYSYPDQQLVVTDLPAGKYRLSYHVNPRDRFEEIDLINNVVFVDLYLNVASGTVQVLES